MSARATCHLPVRIDAENARFEITPQGRAALKTIDEEWIRDFFMEHAPRLRYIASRFGVAPQLSEEMVVSLLDDVVVRLIETQFVPENMYRYLNAALRNKLRNDHRDRMRRDATIVADAGPVQTGERIAMHCHSQHGIRAALLDSDAEDVTLSDFVAKLAAFCARTLSDTETIAFDGLMGAVPMKSVAGEIGITYGAARVRLHRTRARMRVLVKDFIASLDTPERRQAEQFFRRAGNRYNSASVA